MDYIIKKDDWHICQICGSKIQDLARIYGGSNIYYSGVFFKHLQEHNITAEEYFEKFSKRPICECGICNQKCDINKKTTGNITWKNYSCGRNKGVLKWSKEAKKTRCGSGNPMHGQIPWNKNKTFSDNTKQKMRMSALKRIERGDFKFTDTKPHKIVCSILEELKIKYKKEHIYEIYAFDIYLIEHDILIEIDGDYFHCNPIKYPNGPINETQKRQTEKDKRKTKCCEDNKKILIRFWENDILNNKEQVICKLKELLKLKK